MLRSAAIILVMCAGAAVTIQVSLNARLAQGLGSPFAAALASSLVAAGVLFPLSMLALAGGAAPQAAERLPLWAWAGGFCGAAYLTSLAFGLPRLGAATSLAVTVAGQLLAAVIVDHFGAFGAQRQAIDATRLLAVALVVAGAALFAFSRHSQ